MGNSINTLPLSDWRDFYVLVGTAAGVLVGATFVVASLVNNVENRSIGMRGFITPTIVHLGSVLVECAILTAPALNAPLLAGLLGAGGFGGVVYCVIVARRIWTMRLDVADRSFYVALPTLAYAALTAAALLALHHGALSLEILALVQVALLVIGMRNAWDMATFLITRDRPPS